MPNIVAIGAFLKENVPNFVELNVRPPNSPGLNPLHYAVWGALQQFVYRQKIQDIEHLKEVLRSCWDTMSQDLIDCAIDQCVCLSVPRRIPTLLDVPRCNLGKW